MVAALLRIDEDLSANTTAIYFDPHRASSQFDLLEGDWVEIVDDESVLQGRPGPLCQVLNLDRERMCVTVAGLRHSEIGVDPSKHPLLRRWDQKDDMAGGGVELIDGAVRVVEKIAELHEQSHLVEYGVLIIPALRHESNRYSARREPGALAYRSLGIALVDYRIEGCRHQYDTISALPQPTWPWLRSVTFSG